jgi:adenosylmethionine-8-amino-7-oxononanoate transaminase
VPARAPKKNNASQIKTFESWDKKYLWHPFTQHYLWEKEPLLIIESGKGPYLFDIQGRRYLDAVSSLWVNIHGHRNPVLDQAFKSQLKKIAHSTFLGLSHVPAIELGRELSKTAPPGLARTFFSDSGATAVEVALKMAYQYWLETQGSKKPIRKEFLAVRGSYHGDTIGAVSVGGIHSFHSKFKPLLFKTHFSMAPSCLRCPFNKTSARHQFRSGEKIKKTPRPGDFRKETGCRWECLKSAEALLKKHSKKIAGVILEPVVQGAAGMNVMPKGYGAALNLLTKKYGTLFIVDEVATGFGRTGTLWASQQENMKPDILCAAKGITGGYSPLAVTLTTEKIFKAFKAPPEQLKTFFHGHSYTAHPLGAAVALANLNLIKSTKLLEKSRRKAHILNRELKSLASLPVVGSIRQAGLMVGIELVQEASSLKLFPPSLRMGNRVCKAMLKRGVWMRPLGDTLVLMPPLVTSDSDIRKLVRELYSVIQNECQT